MTTAQLAARASLVAYRALHFFKLCVLKVFEKYMTRFFS